MARTRLRCAAVAVVLLLAFLGAATAQDDIDFSSFDETDDIDAILYNKLNGPVIPSVAVPAPAPAVVVTPTPTTPAATSSGTAATPAAAPAAAASPATPAAPAAQQPAPVQTPAPVQQPAPVQTPAAIVPVVQASPSPAASPAATPAPAASPTPEPVNELCKAIPGCTACRPQSSSARRLMGSSSDMMGDEGLSGTIMKGSTASGKPTIDFSQFFTSYYDAPNLPYCLACNETAGYTLMGKGRCSCQAGHGDMSPSGKCEQCPDGYISLGGWKASCVECENVAWNNDDHTACMCASGWYGTTNAYSKQASCNQCPGSRPVSKDGSRSAGDCRACPAGTKPNEIYSDCVNVTATATAGTASAGSGSGSGSGKTLADLLAPSPSPAPAAPAPKLWNASTFANASQDWVITSRASSNWSNPITDIIGSMMDNLVMGKPIVKGADTPGELLYKVLTKEAPAAPKIPDLGRIAGQVASLGAVLGAVGNGTKLLGSLQKVLTTPGGASNLRTAGAPSPASNLVSFLQALVPKEGAAAVAAAPKPVPVPFIDVPSAPAKGSSTSVSTSATPVRVAAPGTAVKSPSTPAKMPSKAPASTGSKALTGTKKAPTPAKPAKST